MKLHLPLGLLMAVLAATSVTEAKTKTFLRENINITGKWDTSGAAYHLNIAEALGLEGGLTPDMQWAVDIKLRDFRSTGYQITSKSDTSSPGTNDFNLNFDFEEDTLSISGYGWVTNGGSIGVPWSTTFSLVHMLAPQALSTTLYGAWSEDALNRGLVGFYPRAQMDKNSMYADTTGSETTGPGEDWQGLTDLYVHFSFFSAPSITVTYSYDADKLENYYFVGGAGKLSAKVDWEGTPIDGMGQQFFGDAGVFSAYGSMVDPIISEQQTDGYLRTLFGNGTNYMCFAPEGTERQLTEGDIANEFNPTNTNIGPAGTLNVDFGLHLKGIVAIEGTGNYVLNAPNVRFADAGDGNTIEIREGGGSSFVINATGSDDNPTGFTWDGAITLDIASGKTLTLNGTGAGKGNVTITGGGTVSISDATTLGTGGITLKSASTGVGANLRNAERLTSDVKVDASYGGSYNLGELKGEYLKGAKFEAEGNVTGVTGTVTLTGSDFGFFVGAGNLTDVASRDAVVSAGGTYLMQFNGTGGLRFDDGATVSLKFSNDAITKVNETDGYLDLWFSNATFEGIDGETLEDPKKLVEWFNSHFTLESGVEAEELVEIHDIITGKNGGNGGVLRLLISADGIWMASKHGDPLYADYISDEKWQQVRVDTDMTVDYTDSDQGEFILRNLNSGDGEGNLTVNSAGKEGLTLTVDQSGEALSDTLKGDIILGRSEDGSNAINVKKTGKNDLHVTGDIIGAGDLAVVGGGKLIIDGSDSTANSLSQVDSDLEINGLLTLEKNSGVLKSEGGKGKISGSGMLHLKGGSMDMGEVSLNGVGLWLDEKEKDSGEYASLTTYGDRDTISGVRGGDGHGNGGTLTLGGKQLIIDGRGSDTGASDFSGTINTEGSGDITITVQGKGTEQMLRSAGNPSVNLDVKEGAFLSLAGGGDVTDGDLKQVTTYKNVTVGTAEGTEKEPSALTVQAQDFGTDYAAVTQLQAESLTVNAGAQLNVLYNLASAENDLSGLKADHDPVAPAIDVQSFTWDPTATLGLGTVGANLYDVSNPQNIEGLVVAKVEGVTGLSNGDEVQFELGGSFLVYWRDVKVTYEDGNIIVNAKANNKNVLLDAAGGDENSTAGAEMLWAARTSQPMQKEGSEILKLMTWAAYQLDGNPGEVKKALAAVAGSTVPIMGTAQRNAMRNQLTRMRNHAGLMGLNEDYTYTELPFVHFWVEANGDFNKLDDGDGYESGYSYNAWGGTMGLEMDVDETTSIAAGITALYGDIDGGVADLADGKLDSYYLSVMGRFQRKRWGHTVVGVVGLNEAKLNRTVSYSGGSYNTHGSTDGYSAGLMYEATYDIPMDLDGTSVVQPLLNFSVMKTTLKGYNESGQDGQGVGLNVGDQDWVTATVGLGVRWIGTVGESGFNRSAQVEVRANIAQDLGDSQGEAAVALQANPSVSRNVKAAEVGKTALQVGASLRVPVNEQTQLYFNADADFRDAMTSWNLGVGMRYDF